LRFEATENVDSLICKIDNLEEISLLKERLKFLPKKQIVIEFDNSLFDQISNLLHSLSLSFSWFLFGKMNVFIKI
jgi:hypothetical protein